MPEPTDDTLLLRRAGEVLAEVGLVVDDATVLAGGRHDVVHVRPRDHDPVVVKLYRDAAVNHSHNVESLLHERLAGQPAVRDLLHRGADHLAVRYAPGATLVDVVRGGLDPAAAARIATQLVAFVRACTAIDGASWGDPGPHLAGVPGAAPTWTAHLRRHLDATQARVHALPDDVAAPLAGRLAALAAAVDERTADLDGAGRGLVPLDLNLANLVLDDEGRLTVVDLETFWFADPLLALGEWTAHTYGTVLHPAVLRAWGPLSAAEHRRVRLYALLATLDIEVFVAETGGDPEAATPWGNPHPFGLLASLHARALDARVLPEDLLVADPGLADVHAGPDPRSDGMGRVEDPALTLARVDAVRHRAGITRVAELTGLDETGVSVHQSTRPEAQDAQDTFTVFAGRGADEVQSKVSSLAEAVERFCAERAGAPAALLREDCARDLRRAGEDVVGPEEFNLPADTGYDDTTPLEWTPARDLRTSATVWVPSCAVFYPYPQPAPLRYFTTGLGAGNHRLEAVAHGLAEAVERDAAALNRLVRGCPAVRPESIDHPAARAELDHLRSAGLDVVVRWIAPPDVGVPAFSVLATDRLLDDPAYVSGGYGAHPDRGVALVRALREAAASRVGTISGAREDLGKFRDRPARTVREVRERYPYWFDTTGAVDYTDLPDLAGTGPLDDLATMTGALAAAGLDRVLVVDLTRPGLGLTVVKVLVPRLERYSFRAVCVGERARDAYRARYGRDLPLPSLHRHQTRQTRTEEVGIL
ncbi:MAG: YcaO-like family protein [Kineosporiaceae bacterium]